MGVAADHTVGFELIGDGLQHVVVAVLTKGWDRVIGDAVHDRDALSGNLHPDDQRQIGKEAELSLGQLRARPPTVSDLAGLLAQPLLVGSPNNLAVGVAYRAGPAALADCRDTVGR